MKILLLMISVLFFLSVSIVETVDGGTDDNLFLITTSPRALPANERSSIASSRESKIRFNTAITAGIVSAKTLEIPLFDEKSFTAERRGTDVRGLDDITWRGKIVVGEFEGDVILTFGKGFVAGLIYSPGAVFEIVARGDDHYLVEIDQRAFPDCGGEIKGDNPVVSDAPLATRDRADRIDVLVVYTTATKNFLGGDAQARIHAQQAIDATNTAYLNSGILQRVHMVHSQEYQYTETGSASADLSALRSNPAIQALRNTHRADLVAMIGEMQGVCGIGYLMGPIPGNQNNGYSATARSCAVGNLSFAHELGHNMGSHHNPENGGTPTFPYGFGHYVNGVFRTVLSYSDPCPSGCTRVPYFSNPLVSFSGFPTGIVNARDNARSINNTAINIANYRYSTSRIPTP